MPPEHLPALITSIAGVIAVIWGAVQWQLGRQDAVQRERAAVAVERENEDHEELVEINRGLKSENHRLRQLVFAHEVDWSVRWGWITSAYTRLLQIDPKWPPPPHPTPPPHNDTKE